VIESEKSGPSTQVKSIHLTPQIHGNGEFFHIFKFFSPLFLRKCVFTYTGLSQSVIPSISVSSTSGPITSDFLKTGQRWEEREVFMLLDCCKEFLPRIAKKNCSEKLIWAEVSA
jgi:hypothetical protein